MKLLTKLLLTPLFRSLIKHLIKKRNLQESRYKFRDHIIRKMEDEIKEELMITHLELK